MISYIKGDIEEILEDRIVVEANNIGYNIFVTADMLSRANSNRKNVKVYTYMNVKEDAVTLYGFSNRDELNIFKMIIGVSGIGPKGAIAILSHMSVDRLRLAVMADDSKEIAKTPGIGAKTASKLILELKDKISIEDITMQGNEASENVSISGDNDDAKEAVEALVALGYPSTDALKAVKKVDMSKINTVEDIIKQALKNIR